jgi:transcriptional regulator with XRE-family HTH domain
MKRAVVRGKENPAGRLRIRPNTFGEFLRKARIAKHMPRTSLATLTGLSEKTIAGFESNQSVPSATEMGKLAPLLGLEKRDILIRAGCINREGTFEGQE